MSNSPQTTHSRRTFLAGAAALVVASCTGTDDEDSTATATTQSAQTSTSGVATEQTTGSDVDASTASEGLDALTAAMFTALPVCTALPSSAAGPFPSIEQLDRRDVTEDYPGHPLRLGIRVVDGDCQPVPGAEVEIWHADATGDYSSFEDGGDGKDEGEGTTFLRGFQTADDDGILEFQTIYPGWYPGRAVHIHTRVRVGGDNVLTAQLYFDEAYTEAVYQTGEYAQFGTPDTSWAADGLAGDPTTDGTGIVLAAGVTSRGDGSVGLLNIGVDV